MEQENLLSCPQSSVSENGEYVTYYGSAQALASSSTNYYSDSNFMRENRLSSCSSYQHAACNYQQNEYNSETNYSEPAQTLTSREGTSHEGTSHEGFSYEGTSHECRSYERTSYERTSHEGTSHEGALHVGTSHEGTSHEGTSHEGTSYDGPLYKSASCEGTSCEGTSCEGTSCEGTSCEGTSCEGASCEGISHEGTSYQGTSHEGTLFEGISYEDCEDISLDDCCACNSGNFSNGSSGDSEAEDREIFGEIINELFEEIVIEHCFQVHQAKKVGAFIFEDAIEEPSQEQRDAPVNTVTCPNCLNKHDLKDYKVKLGECMGLTTRKSKRTTRAKSNFDETIIDSFPSHSPQNSSKSKKRKQPSKKATKSAKIRLQQDGYDILSKEACGHGSKSGNRRTKKGNYPTHKPHTKSTSTMPELDFRYSTPSSYPEEYEIDVDTVEDSPPCYLTDDSPPEFNSLVTRSEENGKIKVIIKSDLSQKKKKKKKSKHDYYPGSI